MFPSLAFKKRQLNAVECAIPADVRREVPNVDFVAPGIMRGGQPSREGVRLLKELGVKTIINLRDDDFAVTREGLVARRLGMKFINIPLDAFSAPSAVALKKFLKVLGDRRNFPVFVHCLHGRERTGVMIGLFRMGQMNWSVQQAYEEMSKYGFRPAFISLGRSLVEFSRLKMKSES